MNLYQLESSIRSCTICKSILSEYQVEPRPVFSGAEGSPIMLIGQAPGITEYREGNPFQGDAGKSIKKLFSECGIANFDANVYQTSITKCFPGRKINLSVDRKPSQKEVLNCLPFLFQQISIIKPKIIVCLGMVAWKTLIEVKEKESKGFCTLMYSKKLSELKTNDIIGKEFIYQGAIVIPMIHPSGAANGAREKNKEQHSMSISILAERIKQLELLGNYNG